MIKMVYLGLGSNIGDREAELRTAVRKLDAYDFRIRKVSPVFESEPMYMTDQPPFLNAVVQAETTLFPMRLLLRIANLEKQMGRRRLAKNGPRNIDIDILLFGRFVVNTPQLQIPHPRMPERRFVLEPMVELAPDLRHPVLRRTMKELLMAVPSAGRLRRTDIRLDVTLNVGQE